MSSRGKQNQRDIRRIADAARIIFNAQRASGQIEDSFEVMCAAWTVGAAEDARAIHGRLGDHDPFQCPICMPTQHGTPLAASSENTVELMETSS